MLIRLLAVLSLLLFAVPAAAQPSGVITSLSSPGAVLKVDVTLNGEGRVGYQVSRLGKPVVGDSQLGFLFTDQPQMLRNFALVGQRTSDRDESWTTPWGEDRTIRNRYRELVVDFEEKTSLKRRMSIDLRVYDDGVGFRYRLARKLGFDAGADIAYGPDGVVWYLQFGHAWSFGMD